MVKGLSQDGSQRASSAQRQNWDKEEIAQLSQAVKECGMNWFKIAKQMPKRNPNQCAQKWKNLNGLRSQTKRFWTQEEDEQLIKYVGLVGKNWTYIASQMENRNNRQCRDRYVNVVDPTLKDQEFSPEEDLLIYEKFILYGPKWSKISKELDGTDNQVKNRFATHIRPQFFKLENPYYTKISAEQAKASLEEARQNHFHQLKNTHFLQDEEKEAEINYDKLSEIIFLQTEEQYSNCSWIESCNY